MTAEWQCSDDRIKSVAGNWCHECKKFLKEFWQKHNMSGLDEMTRDEAMKLMTNELSFSYENQKPFLSDLCFYNAYYESHPSDFPGCSPQSLSVREEASKQKFHDVPVSHEEMDDFELFLKRQIAKTIKSADDLKEECDDECARIWEDYVEMGDNAIKRREELCEEIRKMADEQVGKWRHLLKENERILKRLEIWRINLKHLRSDSPQEVDVACGLKTWGSKLSSGLENTPSGPGGECHLTVSFSKWWPQILQQLKDERIGSVSLMFDKLSSAKSISPEKECILQKSNPQAAIGSIHISKEDNHIFLCECDEQSIM